MTEVRLTEETLNYMTEIHKVATDYGLTLMELLGATRTEKTIAARVELCRQLFGMKLTISTIARVIGRDRATVRTMLQRKVNLTPAYFERRDVVAEVAPREQPAQRYRANCVRGSKALADAIFATGKTHGPMSEQQQMDAVLWARGGLKKLHATGWMV